VTVGVHVDARHNHQPFGMVGGVTAFTSCQRGFMNTDVYAAPTVCANRLTMWRSSLKPAFWVSLTSLALGGCRGRGAPSFVIVGSYFPGWMLCALIGIGLAIAVRIGFVTSGLANVLPYQLFVCAAIGLCGTLVVWLLWFGQ
jgi:YtcA family